MLRTQSPVFTCVLLAVTSSSSRGQEFLYTVYGPPSAYQFGARVSGADDVDEDGVSDLIIGEWGRAHVLSGKDGSPIYLLKGDEKSGVAFGQVSEPATSTAMVAATFSSATPRTVWCTNSNGMVQELGRPIPGRSHASPLILS